MNRSKLGPGRGEVRAPSPPLPESPTAGITTGDENFVALVAEEIAFGIDRAVRYWLGRIERQLAVPGQTPAERIAAIEQILSEFKDGPAGLAKASATA